jgi:hypothetical protein
MNKNQTISKTYLFESPPHSLLINPSKRKEQCVNTENEKTVRDPMREAFEKWWRDSGGGPVSMKVNARHTWQNAWQAALQSQVSNTPQDGEIARSLREWLKFWIANFHNGYPQKHNLELALNYIDGIAPQQQEQSGEAWTAEQEYAICEGHRIANEETYFSARPQIDTNDRRRVFGAGFDKGWDAARAETLAATPTATASQESTPTSDQTGREPT